jgi:RNase P subunit RPR2
MNRTTCKDCGGTLWPVQNVGGKFNNNNVDEAIQLIKAGKHPWSSY